MVTFFLEALLKDNGCYILSQNFNHKYTKSQYLY